MKRTTQVIIHVLKDRATEARHIFDSLNIPYMEKNWIIRNDISEFVFKNITNYKKETLLREFPVDLFAIRATSSIDSDTPQVWNQNPEAGSESTLLICVKTRDIENARALADALNIPYKENYGYENDTTKITFNCRSNYILRQILFSLGPYILSSEVK
jgi:hypothetical protein